MFKEYEDFGLTEDEYWKCRQNMNEASYHLHQTFNEDDGKSSLLYFDSDDGVALITNYCDIFDGDGFKIELIDCNYCDIKKLDMVEIIHILEEFEEKSIKKFEENEDE